MTEDSRDHGWERDRVVTSTGVVVPVRATARRPTWDELPDGVRGLIEGRVGRSVGSAWSAGTGFTPGFASKLTLDDGTAIFVKAASSAYDRVHGWPLSDAYREEARKLVHMPAGIGAPHLLWHEDSHLAGEQWIVMAFECIDGAPPRRPWREGQLWLVMDKLAQIAARLTPPPRGIALDTVATELVAGTDARLHAVAQRGDDPHWLTAMADLSAAAPALLAGDSVVHMDLRDDNVLIDDRGEVWFVDWNWPVVGAPWIDLVCILISAVGDGYDGDALLAAHRLTRDVEPRAIDALLAVVWTFWAASVDDPAPHGSPHLRDHQRWYLDVTRDWLTRRLAH